MRQDDLFKVMAVLLACDDPRNFLASNGASKRELLFNYYPLTSLRSRSYALPLSFVNCRLVVLASLFASLCGRFKLQCLNSWAAPADRNIWQNRHFTSLLRLHHVDHRHHRLWLSAFQSPAGGPAILRVDACIFHSHCHIHSKCMAISIYIHVYTYIALWL